MLNAMADIQPLATMNDPVGDDNGAGALVYPRRSDFHAGDLDLVKLKIGRDKEGFWFEAMFKNPVRDPGGVINGVGGESLANYARKGFYQFNLDIYVDTDRVKGSGNTLTLPGRQVRIDSNYAWEKVVVLTPRPELMRRQLLDALTDQYPERSSAEIDAGVDKSIFFPTRIRVHDKSVSFFVPAGFFDGSDGTDWAATAFVTGAIVNIPANFSLVASARKPLEEIQLGVMQPVSGHPQDTFGYSGANPGPVIDMLGDSVGHGYATGIDLTGVAWGVHALGSALSAVSNVPATEGSKTAAAPAASVDKLFQSGSHTANSATPGQAETGSSAEQSIVKRLQTLQQLFDQKLIDETEYKQQKQRILKEL
jgi:hypothetical protein